MAATTVKTRTDLDNDIRSGNLLEGTYDAGDRPVVLDDANPRLCGHPSRQARINGNCGPVIIAGWKAPTHPAELWTADGGLRLRSSTGKPYRITINNGKYTHPGAAPQFWGNLTFAEWVIDFSMASYIGPGSAPYPLFGLRDRDTKQAAPVMVLTQGKRLIVYWTDDTGQHSFGALILNDAPGARNKVTIRYADGKITASSAIGSAEALVTGRLARNIANAFQIGSGADDMIGNAVWQPGDLTLYSFVFSHGPSKTGVPYSQPLKIPAVGDWWLGMGAILHDPAAANATVSQKDIKIQDVEIRGNGRMTDGAAVMLGYGGPCFTIRDVKTGYTDVGIGTFGGPSYRITVDGWLCKGHSLAGFFGRTPIGTISNVSFDRNGRDDMMFRGGDMVVRDCLQTPGGNDLKTWRESTFRVISHEDGAILNLYNYRGDDESNQTPTIAHILADATMDRWGNSIRISLNNSSFAQGAQVAVLTGKFDPSKPNVGLGVLTINNVNTLTSNPTITASPAWKVVGVPDPNRNVPPSPIPYVPPSPVVVQA